MSDDQTPSPTPMINPATWARLHFINGKEGRVTHNTLMAKLLAPGEKNAEGITVPNLCHAPMPQINTINQLAADGYIVKDHTRQGMVSYKLTEKAHEVLALGKPTPAESAAHAVYILQPGEVSKSTLEIVRFIADSPKGIVGSSRLKSKMLPMVNNGEITHDSTTLIDPTIQQEIARLLREHYIEKSIKKQSFVQGSSYIVGEKGKAALAVEAQTTAEPVIKEKPVKSKKAIPYADISDEDFRKSLGPEARRVMDHVKRVLNKKSSKNKGEIEL
jgi:hypothetical protein